jgi:hypothetical protein
MRIFGFEITRAPRPHPYVWHRIYGRASRITDMTPDQLRAELFFLRVQAATPNGVHLRVRRNDHKHQLIVSTDRKA